MEKYIITHCHRHGTDIACVQSEKNLLNLSDVDLAKILDMDFEPDIEGEYIDIDMLEIRTV